MTPAERPILFSSAMVRAILDGSKTMTRRVVKPQPVSARYRVNRLHMSRNEVLSVRVKDGTASPGSPSHLNECPHGKTGDRLWVRETFYNDLPEEQNLEHVYYRADGECCEQIPECQCADVGKPKWKPSIHMPRWASRITLEITSVRVERLQQLSELDAQAEGMEKAPAKYVYGFRNLWHKLHGRQNSWTENPFVWVIQFRKL